MLMPIVLCHRCGHYADNSKTNYCPLCGKQLMNTEYSSEDSDEGVFSNGTTETETTETQLQHQQRKIQNRKDR